MFSNKKTVNSRSTNSFPCMQEFFCYVMHSWSFYIFLRIKTYVFLFIIFVDVKEVYIIFLLYNVLNYNFGVCCAENSCEATPANRLAAGVRVFHISFNNELLNSMPVLSIHIWTASWAFHYVKPPFRNKT